MQAPARVVSICQLAFMVSLTISSHNILLAPSNSKRSSLDSRRAVSWARVWACVCTSGLLPLRAAVFCISSLPQTLDQHLLRAMVQSGLWCNLRWVEQGRLVGPSLPCHPSEGSLCSTHPVSNEAHENLNCPDFGSDGARDSKLFHYAAACPRVHVAGSLPQHQHQPLP